MFPIFLDFYLYIINVNKEWIIIVWGETIEDENHTAADGHSLFFFT